MEYRGVKLVWVENKKHYIFIYNGCPHKPLTNHYGDELNVPTKLKAFGFIDCLIQLGQI